MLVTSAVVDCLADAWGLADATVEVHDRGMNSQTWLVTLGADRWVAKAVGTADQPGFVAGLAVARRVAEAGIPSGSPEPTRDGRLAVEIEGRTLALLAFVEGQPLTADDAGQMRLIGSTLARAHRALSTYAEPAAERFHWIDPANAALDVAPWVRPAVTDALAAYEALDPGSLTWGLLHSDPAPEAFLVDSDGTCGLIDWDRALFGPLMYDLASAVMYVGGPDRGDPLVDAYLGQRILGPAEVERAMVPMLGLRQAVQADYFSGRIARTDLTGITSPAENEKGLEDARRGLEDIARRRAGQASR